MVESKDIKKNGHLIVTTIRAKRKVAFLMPFFDMILSRNYRTFVYRINYNWQKKNILKPNL